MKIQKVKIKDFKVIKDLEKEINGANLILIGDNGVGKSSFMQFIEIALGRTDNIPPNAMGEGEVITNKNGEEFRFVVKIKDGKPKVTIIAPNGLKDDRKSALAAIVGGIDFDINEFVSLSETVPGRRRQVEIYKSLLPADVVAQLNVFETNIRIEAEARTETNREIKMLKGYLKASPLYGAHTKMQAVDVSDLQAKLNEANKHNATVNDVSTRMEARKREVITDMGEVQRIEEEIKAMEVRVAGLKLKIEADKKKNTEAGQWLDKNKVVDTVTIVTQMGAASEQNKQYAEAQELIKNEAKVEALENEVGEQTAHIESYREAITTAIREMESPVAGLSFDDDGLVYNGIAVSKASLSTSEIIHLGCRLKMAQNNEFGVLCIEHGESLGTDRLNEIKAMAEKQGWQIIMEQVERGTKELRFEFMTDSKS